MGPMKCNDNEHESKEGFDFFFLIVAQKCHKQF